MQRAQYAIQSNVFDLVCTAVLEKKKGTVLYRAMYLIWFVGQLWKKKNCCNFV